MNYLLVMPRIVDRVGKWYIFPSRIPYVSVSMKKNGIDVITLNLNNETGDVSTILKKYIKENSIDIVLTAGLSAQYNAIKDILVSAKKIHENIITIVGKGIITSIPKLGMKVLEKADFGIVGEGEITTCELCQA